MNLKFIPLLLFCTLACTPVAVTPPLTGVPPAIASPTLNPAQVDATSGAKVQATHRVEATQAAFATATAQAEATRAARATEQQLASEATAAAWSTTEAAALLAKAHSLQTAQAPWPVLVQESFVEPNVLRWPTGAVGNDVLTLTATFTNSQYVWAAEAAPERTARNLIPIQRLLLGNLTDFYMTVDLAFLGEAPEDDYAYGVTFYEGSGSYGFWGVQRDGVVRLMRVQGGSLVMVSGHTDAFRPGVTNHLAVRAYRGKVLCFLNDAPVGDFAEVSQFGNKLVAGALGLGLYSYAGSGPSQVAFSNFVVYAP